MSNGQSGSNTAPAQAPAAAAATRGVIESGVATQIWIELVPIPAADTRLWLFVDGQWRHLDSVRDAILASVQSAFCNCPDRLEVAVWYDNDVIVGLVVRSK